MKTHLLTLFCAAIALSVPALAEGTKAALPLVIYNEPGANNPFIPSGYMGNTGALKLSDSTENPKVGKTCLKAEYTAGDNWGGIVWQSPANDWGDQPGGYNITGATKLTFWARGAKGGETVTFISGLIGKDKKYPDSLNAKLDKQKLTADWQQYTIDLKGQDLTQVKSGFCWVVGAEGQPVTFYLDDVKFE